MEPAATAANSRQMVEMEVGFCQNHLRQRVA